jgi:NitT/TauT family transport system substrate-binding protein
MRWQRIGLGLGLLVVIACATPAPSRPPGAAGSPASGSAAAVSAPAQPSTGGSGPSTPPNPGGSPAAAQAGSPAGLGGSGGAAPPPLAPPVTLKIATLLGLTDAGVFIGMDRGYFAEEGIEIDLTRVDGAAQAMPHVATGSLDLAGVTPSSAFYNAVLRGLPLRIAADKGRMKVGASPSLWAMRPDVAASGAVRDWADLRGRTLGINVPNTGTVTDIMLDNALGRGGLTRDDVTIVELPYPDMNTALATGAVELVQHTEPWVTQGANLGVLERWRSGADATPDQYTGVWLYGPSFGEAAAANRFMVAYLRGARVYNDAIAHGRDKAGVVESLTRHTAVKDPALYTQMNFSYIDPDGRVDPALLAADVRYYLAKGFMQQPIDVQQVVEQRYVDYALSRLGPYKPPTP